MDGQMTIPGVEDFTGLNALQYMSKLLDLVLRCQAMDPDRYLHELDHLCRLRAVGRKQEVSHG